MAGKDVANVALTIAGQINPLIEQAIRAFAAYAAARRAAIAANPTLPDGTIKTPAEVFEMLISSGALLESEVAEARARVAALPPAVPTGVVGGVKIGDNAAETDTMGGTRHLDK